jgi:hypothetical protein
MSCVRHPSRARRHPIRINYIASCLHLHFMLIKLSVNLSRAFSEYACRAEHTIPISSVSTSLPKSGRFFLGSSRLRVISVSITIADRFVAHISVASTSELLFKSVPRRRLSAIRFNCARLMTIARSRARSQILLLAWRARQIVGLIGRHHVAAPRLTEDEYDKNVSVC